MCWGGIYALRSRYLFLEYPNAAGRAKGSALLVEVLPARRYASVADEHPASAEIWLAVHGFLLSQIMSQVFYH